MVYNWRNINSVEIFVFFSISIITVIFIMMYNIIRPNFSEKSKNLLKAPKSKPKNIPDPSVLIDKKCVNTIKQCKDNSDCADCGTNYECETIDKNTNVEINNKQISDGKYCLPKGIQDIGCNNYTGKYVWSYDGGKQNWKCQCIYPDLFGGDDCSKQFACKINGIDLSKQENNYLQNQRTKDKWDPNDENFDSSNSPYDMDTLNKFSSPLFKCNCGIINMSATEQLNTVNLPQDPYNCYLNPCNVEHRAEGVTENAWDKENLTCNCGNQSNIFKSNVTGQCLMCPKYDWDKKNNACNCNTDTEERILCNDPETYIRNGMPDCPKDRNTIGGSYCKNLCEDTNCMINGENVCVINKNGFTRYKSTYYKEKKEPKCDAIAQKLKPICKVDCKKKFEADKNFQNTLKNFVNSNCDKKNFDKDCKNITNCLNDYCEPVCPPGTYIGGIAGAFGGTSTDISKVCSKCGYGIDIKSGGAMSGGAKDLFCKKRP